MVLSLVLDGLGELAQALMRPFVHVPLLLFSCIIYFAHNLVIW